MVLYIEILFLYNLFSTSRFFKIVSFTFDLVHSLSMCFIHSIISFLFRLVTAPTLLMRGGLFRSLPDYVVIPDKYPVDSCLI